MQTFYYCKLMIFFHWTTITITMQHMVTDLHQFLYIPDLLWHTHSSKVICHPSLTQVYNDCQAHEYCTVKEQQWWFYCLLVKLYTGTYFWVCSVCSLLGPGRWLSITYWFCHWPSTPCMKFLLASGCFG